MGKPKARAASLGDLEAYRGRIVSKLFPGHGTKPFKGEVRLWSQTRARADNACEAALFLGCRRRSPARAQVKDVDLSGRDNMPFQVSGGWARLLRRWRMPHCAGNTPPLEWPARSWHIPPPPWHVPHVLPLCPRCRRRSSTRTATRSG